MAHARSAAARLSNGISSGLTVAKDDGDVVDK
jgi:hypothetical protein